MSETTPKAKISADFAARRAENAKQTLRELEPGDGVLFPHEGMNTAGHGYRVVQAANRDTFETADVESFLHAQANTTEMLPTDTLDGLDAYFDRNSSLALSRYARLSLGTRAASLMKGSVLVVRRGNGPRTSEAELRRMRDDARLQNE